MLCRVFSFMANSVLPFDYNSIYSENFFIIILIFVITVNWLWSTIFQRGKSDRLTDFSVLSKYANVYNVCCLEICGRDILINTG